MDRHDDELDADRNVDNTAVGDSTVGDGESHATTGGAAAAGAVTGGVIGLTGGPIGAAIGAVGGAIVGAAAERMMHSDDDAERAQAGLDNDHDSNPLIEDRSRSGAEYSGATARGDIDASTMQLREEQLRARTTPVETGEVQIHKDVVEEERTMDVPVTREEVYVERTPVDRRPADTPVSEDDRTIEVPVREERVTMDKQPVVYEEVGIGKRQVTDTERVSGTVRREEARVDREGDIDVRETDRT